MSKPVLQRPKADEDIAAIFACLRAESAQAAVKVLDAVQSAYELLADQPAIGFTRHAAHCPELPYPVRFHPIKGFPRVPVYYMDTPRAVEIIRVWDSARGLTALVEGIEPRASP